MMPGVLDAAGRRQKKKKTMRLSYDLDVRVQMRAPMLDAKLKMLKSRHEQALQHRKK